MGATEQAPARKPPVTARTLIIVLTNVVSIACLAWTLRDAELGEMQHDLATMKWWWVGFAFVTDIVAYGWHGLRWSLLLRPVVQISPLRAMRAIYVGLFANEVLPLRVGEVLRCYLLTRWTALPFSVSIASALIERVFDGIWLYLCLLLTFQMLPMPRALRYLDDAGYGLGVVVLIGAIVITVALFQRQLARSYLTGEGWRRRAVTLLDDLAMMGHSRYLILAFLQSLPYLLLQTIPVWAAFKGYGLDLGIREAFVLMIFLRLATSIPSAPGNLGIYQFVAKEIMEKLFHVAGAEAARFSLVLWGIVTIPLLLAGVLALMVTGVRVGELRRAAQEEAENYENRA